MKIPVFLGPTMELIAIIRMDDHHLSNISGHGGYIRFCEYPSMSNGPMTGAGPTQDIVRVMDFKGYPIRSNTAQSFYLLVNRHDDLRFFKKRIIWPKQRTGQKFSKAERKYRREHEMGYGARTFRYASK
jgi:hypothetical protein